MRSVKKKLWNCTGKNEIRYATCATSFFSEEWFTWPSWPWGLSSTGSFWDYSKQWEIQSSRKMKHISNYSYHKLFFAIFYKSFRKRHLLYVASNRFTIYLFYAIPEKCKWNHIIFQCLSVSFRISGLKLRENSNCERNQLLINFVDIITV